MSEVKQQRHQIVTARIPAQLASRAKWYGRRRHWSRSEVIRQALRSYLRDKPKGVREK